LSGPALTRDYAENSEEFLMPEKMASLAENGDKKANLAMSRYVDRFARASASIINTLDPNVIVLGGGLSQISRLYRDVPKLWPKYVFSDTVVTQLMAPRHGSSSGVRGAAWLWP